MISHLGFDKMGESCPNLLDLIPNDKQWVVNREGEERKHGSSSSSHENKLELRLGLPCDEDWSTKKGPKKSLIRERNESHLSLGYFSSSKHQTNGYQGQQQIHQPNTTPFLQHQYQTGPFNPKGLPVMAKESSQPCCTRIVNLQNAEKKAFSPASANTAVPNSSQKRAAPAPVVGWPPIRSFRRNLASTSSAKSVTEELNTVARKPVNGKPAVKNSHKGLFVKINMDGVPIGRKVDLNAYNTYEKLSSAVDELFRGLLAAQRDSSAGGIEDKQEEQKTITGLMEGNGEYTLVYEDNEGDNMLVGDVPWHMFVSTVKRLRVLKSSELPLLSCGGNKHGRVLVESTSN